MRTCSLLALVIAVVFVVLAAPVCAQATKAQSQPTVDWNAKLKETQSNPHQMDAALKAGAKVAGFCANCHGAAGNSPNPDTPNLAGQNTSYLLEQMHQFSDGRRRNLFMEGMIKALSVDEKIGTVLYYAGQEVSAKPAANVALVNQGHAYYSKICFRCHGEQGRGSDRIARIAGQQVGYLTTTLKRYRDGSSVRADPLMAAITKTMADADIAAVAAYISTIN